MRIAKLALPLVALLLAFTASCESDAPNTLIRLIIDSDLEVGTELTKLEVRIFDRDGKEELRRQDFALGEKREGTRFALPLSIKLAPDSQQSSIDFRVVVTGIGPIGAGGGEVEVVEQQALVSFRPGEALRLDIFLARSCLLKLCREDEDALSSLTCDVETGACVDVPTHQDLPTVSGDGVRQYEEEKDDASGGQLDAGLLDAGGGDAADESDENTDAQLADGSEGRDASEGIDARADAASAASSGTATANTVCEEEGARACGGHNSSDALLCSGGKWTVRAVCDGNTRCDTREGGNRGACQAVVAGCVGKQPNDVVCEGTILRTCGADLVDSTTAPCAVNQHCVASPSAHCECDAGYQSGAGGACTNIDECAGHACQHGSKCVDGIAKYACDCAGTGYEGEFCQTDIDECAQTTECNAHYPCVQTQAPGYTCLGQMADWPMPDSTPGAKFAPSYDVSVAGVVKDRVTGLWWENNNDGASYSLAVATAHCQQLVTDSRNDWRLPTLIELGSIIDFSRSNPALNQAFLSVGTDQHYWTSSPNIEYLDTVWTVTFLTGETFRSSATEDLRRVRCVRSDPPKRGTPLARFQVNVAEDTVLDARTTLIWQHLVDRQKRSPIAAQTYCQSRGEGWRLPSIKELLTLSDPTTSPSIDTHAFPETPTDWFLSSTTLKDDPSQNWQLLFNYPYTGGWPAASGGLVRCVK